MRAQSFAAVLFCLGLGVPQLARADASGVGLGVAGGFAYSHTKVDRAGVQEAVGARPAWGFFVDIPLLPTFYISPAAMLYTMKGINGDTKDEAITDVDLNFKFIVPVGALHFGAGLTAGLSSGVESGYVPHYGVLGFASLNLVANLDGFALVQYKRLSRSTSPQIDDWHGFLGAMFHF